MDSLQFMVDFCEGSWWLTMIWNLILIMFMGDGGFLVGSLCFVVGFTVVRDDPCESA